MTRRVRSDARVSDGGTRQRIIAAGTALFAERGSAASSMRELADRAGVALSASYYHFPSKRDVLLAIMTEAMENLEEGALEVLGRELPPIERLPALMKAHVRVHLEQPDLARVADTELRALDPEARAEIVAIRDRYEAYFRAVLTEGVEDGSFSPTLDIAVTAMALITMGTSTVEWWRPDGRLSIDETASILSGMAVTMAVHGYGGASPEAESV